MAQRKERKTKVKVQDLKPIKDAKGGMIANNANNANNAHQQNNSLQRGAHQSSQQNRFI